MRALVLAGLIGALGWTGCVDEFRGQPVRVTSFQVEIVNPPTRGGIPYGDPDHLLPLPLEPLQLRLRATALCNDGQPCPFSGRARVHVTPGRTIPTLAWIDFPERDDGAPGVAEANVTVLAVHSDTRVWVVDDIPDGSGRNRPARSEPVTHSVGVSPNLYFDHPTLAAANAIPPQGDNTESFYPGDFVSMSRIGDVWDETCKRLPRAPTKRDLIVTAITSNGFFVTDLAEAPASPGNFGHLFVFNFSYPEDLQPGDRISHLQGTLLDFSGNTQLGFPVWKKDLCPPDFETLARLETHAPAIDTAICTKGSSPQISEQSCGYSSSNFAMESLESALVKLPTIALPDLWVRCDFDGNGEASNYMQVGSAFGCGDANDAECACVLACATGTKFPQEGAPYLRSVPEGFSFDATGRSCTERTGYDSFGQYVVRLVENGKLGPRLNLQSRDSVPDFDPTTTPGARLSARGILTHVRAARPRWVVAPRQPSDLCCVDAGTCPEGLSLCN